MLAFYRRELGKKGWIEQSRTPSSPPIAPRSHSPRRKRRQRCRSIANTIWPPCRSTYKFCHLRIAARAKTKKKQTTALSRMHSRSGKRLLPKRMRSALRHKPRVGRKLRCARWTVRAHRFRPRHRQRDRLRRRRWQARIHQLIKRQRAGGFYRSGMKTLGWKSTPSVINNPNMVVLNFSKAKQSISLTAMQMGPKVSVTATGSGLKGVPVAAVATHHRQRQERRTRFRVRWRHRLSPHRSSGRCDRWVLQGCQAARRSDMS